MLRRRRFALSICGLVLLVESALSAAGPVMRVRVSVSGEGAAIRVQVASVVGQTPCDSPNALRLVDAMVEPGQSVEVDSPTPCVCYRHTNGYFRRLDFGPHQIRCWPRRPNDSPVLDIPIIARR